MLKEWLLIAWMGTSTNFVLLDYYYSEQQCQRALAEQSSRVPDTVTLACSQDLREGRSELPRRGLNTGIIKK
jgi:hypothetical protein